MSTSGCATAIPAWIAVNGGTATLARAAALTAWSLNRSTVIWSATSRATSRARGPSGSASPAQLGQPER